MTTTIFAIIVAAIGGKPARMRTNNRRRGCAQPNHSNDPKNAHHLSRCGLANSAHYAAKTQIKSA